MTTFISLNLAQLNEIRTLGAARDYPNVYRYVAAQIEANAIPGIVGGATSKEYFWFAEAARVNANDVSQPSAVFIRAAARYGILAGGGTGDNASIQNVSNVIGAAFVRTVNENTALPNMAGLLNIDIGSSIAAGGITLGGWGGSAYFWKEAYTDPVTNIPTTVGKYIESRPEELGKFLAVTSSATADTLQRFGAELAFDPSARAAFIDGVTGFGFESPKAALALSAATQIVLLGRGIQAATPMMQDLQQKIIDLRNSVIDRLNLRQFFSDNNATPVFDANGDVGAVSQVGNQLTGTVLSGDKIGSSFVFTNHAVGADGSDLSFASFTGVPAVSTLNNYTLVVNDGRGGITTTEGRPVQQVFDYGTFTVGSETSVIKKQDGIIVATTVATEITDRLTNETTLTTTSRTYSNTGVLLNTTVETTSGSYTDTPDADGNITRVIDTTANGKSIQITQQADAAALANGEQPGDYDTTGVQINGQPAENASIIAKVIDENYPSAKDIILNRGTGEFTHIVAAGDAGNPDGTTPSLVEITGRMDWWNDPRIGALASDTVSLVSALRSGQPLPIVTAGFNFASHQLADPAVADIAAALSGIGSLKGLVDALEKGDLGRILIDGGGVARSAITIYGNSLQQQLISQYGSVFRAGELATQGNTAAAELYNSAQAVDSLLQTVGTAIAVLNIINSLAKGDIKGAAIGAIALYAGPLVGGILTAIDFFYGQFKPERQYEADGRFVGGANGAITVEQGNVNPVAAEHFNKMMNAMLEQTRQQAAAIGVATNQPMGVIAERLPTIAFKQDVMFLRWNDPQSGHSFVMPQTAEAAYNLIIIANYLYRTWENGIFDAQGAIAANDGVWEVAA